MVTLICGDSSKYRGDADFVFTNPYAPLPPQLVGKPALINLFLPAGREVQRIADGERWVGAKLRFVSYWSNQTNAIFTANIERRVEVDVSDLETVAVYPGGGCFSEKMVRRLLTAFADEIPSGGVIWDGFMGRGTVGKVALEMGYGFVGIDKDPTRHQLAMDYVLQ